jgi:pimeloyl-ACP methyl ester carboxylesterase
MPSFDQRGFSLYHETHGQGPGIPLVLIMGIGATCQGWLVLQVPELSRDRPNVIFDHRGAGRSTDPGGEFTSAELADDVTGLLDHLGIERANILGAFLGGLVAQELALRHPRRVHSLTLVGTYARPDAKRRMLLESWREMIESRVSREALLKWRLLWSLHDLTFEQEDILDAMCRFYLREDAPLEDKVIERQIRACLAHDTVDRLEHIEAPTLVVCGEQDLLTPVHLNRELANRIPNSRLVLIPGAGHLVPAEMAPRFNRLVNRFLLEFD